MLSKEEIVNCLNNITDKYYEKISEIGEDDYNADLDDICCDINELIEKIEDGIEADDYYRGYNERDKLAKKICKECEYREKARELETREQKLIEKLEDKTMIVNKLIDEMFTELKDGTKIINITGLSKKEKEEVVNKRNCLLVQKHCYEEILKILKGENDE